MLQQTSARLVAWANEAVGAPIARLAAPGDTAGERGVAVHLLDLVPEPAPRGVRQARLHLTLRYMATTWAPTPDAAQELLGRLAFAALTMADMEIDREPPSVALWQAMAVRPQPCLLWRCRAWQDLPAATVPLARQIVIETTMAAPFTGQVLTSTGRPVADATVEAPAFSAIARTGADGRFRMPALPSDAPIALIVRTGGHEQIAAVPAASVRSGGPVIHLDTQE